MEPRINPFRSIGICLAILSSILGILFGVLSWTLRDGMGPDSVESHGLEALRRFAGDYWPMAVVCGVLFAAAFLLVRVSHKDNRSIRPAESPDNW